MLAGFSLCHPFAALTSIFLFFVPEWLCQEAWARGQITLCKLFACCIFRISLRKCLLLWELSEFLTFADLSKHDISPFPSPQLLSQWHRTLFRPLCGVFVSELLAQAPCTFHYSFSFCVFFFKLMHTHHFKSQILLQGCQGSISLPTLPAPPEYYALPVTTLTDSLDIYIHNAK